MKLKVAVLFVLLLLLVGVGLPALSASNSMVTGADLIVDFQDGSREGLTAWAGGLALADGALVGRYVSPAIDAPQAFNAAVPQWIAAVPDGTSLSIRVRTAPSIGAWSEWFTVEENDDWMLPDDEDVVGNMIAVPEVDVTHRRIQVAVTLTRYADDPSPVLEELRLTLIDSSQGPSSAELAARAAADEAPPSSPNSYPKPPVISRAVWCTDPACNYTGGLEYEPVTHLIAHHTVSNNGSSNWAAVVRAIWYFHTFTRGWGDIGYNYLVDMNGVLYEGHLGGDDVVGTHASGANAGSMALALIGTFTTATQNPPGIPPPAPMLNSAAELFAWKADQRNIDVFDAGYLPNVSWGLPNLMGHRDVYGATVCPGDQAHALLPWLRNEVANRIGFVSPHQYVDELSGAFTKSNSSNWQVPPGGCGFNGHAYYTWSTTNPAESTYWGEWRPQVPATGRYEVEVYAPYCITGTSETRGAKYTITDMNGVQNVVVDHEANVGTWMSLGEFDFAAGNSNVIHLTDLTTTDNGKGVWFDAIRLRPLAPTAANVSPVQGTWLTNPSVTFNWQIFNSPGIASIQLQVASDSAFNNLLLNQNLPAGATNYTHNFVSSHPQLYWRVKVTATGGGTTISQPTTFGIDMTIPTSSVFGIYFLEGDDFLIAWLGNDTYSGIAGYNIDYQAEGETSWTRWKTNITSTTATFSPPDGRVYWFRSQATDAAGNIEPLHANGDRSTDQAVLRTNVIMMPLIRR